MHRGCFCTCAPRCQQHEGVPSLSHPRPHPIPGTLRMDTTWRALVPAWARGGSASASPKSPMAHVPSSRTSTFWLLRSRCTTLGLYRPGRWDWGGVSQDGEGDTLAEAGRTRHTSGRTHRRARAPGAGKRGRGRGREPGARCRPTSPRAAPGNVAGSPGDTRGDTRGDTGQLPPPTPRARTHLPPSACRGTPPSGAGTGTAQPAWASRAHTCATPAAHAHARAPPRATLPHPPAPRAHPSLPLTAGYSWRTRSPPRARGPAPRVPSSRATLSCSIRGNPCTARSAAKRPAAPATKALMATGRCCRVPRHTAEKRPVCSTCRHPQHPWVPVVTPQVSPLGEGIPRGVG